MMIIEIDQNSKWLCCVFCAIYSELMIAKDLVFRVSECRSDLNFGANFPGFLKNTDY